MSRIATCLLLAVLGSLGLAACGGGSDSSTQSTSESPRGETTAKSDYEGGEESIEKFGSEATGSDKGAILAAEQGYLNGLADGDYATACSYLARPTQQSLEQLVVKQLKAKGCAAILPKLLSPSAPAVARQQANGKITKIRVEGDQAFIIFHAPGAKLYVFTMAQEDGAWKATAVAASVLVPSAATLGTG